MPTCRQDGDNVAGDAPGTVAGHVPADAPDTIPGGAASGIAAPATSTSPSAGDSTSLSDSAAGTRRSGSRKKNAKNSASSTRGTADSHPPIAPASTDSASAPLMKGKPAESIRKLRRRRAGRSVKAPQTSAPPNVSRLS